MKVFIALSLLACVVQAAAKKGDGAEVLRSLNDISSGIKGMSVVILKMWDKCKPEAFWDQIRVPVQGWEKPGIILGGEKSASCVTDSPGIGMSIA